MNTKLDDPTGVNKYDLVLDIIEHPEKYESDLLKEIMSDPETAEIYHLLCKTDSAVKAHKEIDVDAEWKRFSATHSTRPRRYFKWMGSRAASIAAVIFTSIVAVAAGIAISVSIEDKSAPTVIEDNRETAEVSNADNTSEVIIAQTDSVTADPTPVLFENESLETIMNEVATAYDVVVKFNNDEVSDLHLYYRLDPALSIDEVVSQLNTFEQINIKRNGNTLTI
ncbi:MAG: DUF4974 domain-containing protein, partial [Muribaculaceae bacterium]|nr:DUF4974 domain-containing protein [Muribaculaceae bacterium]